MYTIQKPEDVSVINTAIEQLAPIIKTAKNLDMSVNIVGDVTVTIPPYTEIKSLNSLYSLSRPINGMTDSVITVEVRDEYYEIKFHRLLQVGSLILRFIYLNEKQRTVLI